jgi:hypothetical protein
MFKQKRYTIKPNKIGKSPVEIIPTRTNITKQSSMMTYIYIILVLFLMAGVGIGLYYGITAYQENFECQMCQKDEK